jgi:hypothetical protein
MNKIIALTLLIVSTSMLAGCELVGDIFEAGVWFGVILVMLGVERVCRNRSVIG